MARHFRLQRVLELRERAEQETARRLAAREEEATVARDTRDALRDLRATSRDQVEQVHQDGTPVGHLQHMSYLIGQLDRRIAGAHDAVIDAEQAAIRVRGELESAVRDRRIIERLRDKHQDATRLLDQAADRVQMDEIALSRFGRQRDDAANAAASTDTPDGVTRG
ncbi:MAG: flagellar export protein FliJ [Gemmatimonadaceae bacterium]|jgi:flagellar FliJ protein|nr:flagellar export protein FliJ [Gemmatimonadaceae bacterium]